VIVASDSDVEVAATDLREVWRRCEARIAMDHVLGTVERMWRDFCRTDGDADVGGGNRRARWMGESLGGMKIRAGAASNRVRKEAGKSAGTRLVLTSMRRTIYLGT